MYLALWKLDWVFSIRGIFNLKIKSITIENVKSFREGLTIDFAETVNVFVGPNAGGKSNLLDIITVLMRGGFLDAYTVNPGVDNQTAFEDIQRQSTFSPLTNSLEKHIGEETKDSAISVQFTVSQQDVDGLVTVQENEPELIRQLAGYRNKPIQELSFLRRWDTGQITEGTVLKYHFSNGNLQAQSAGTPEHIFREYLQYHDLFLILARRIPNIAMQPLYLYFPPYRALNVQDLSANLAGDNYYSLLHGYYGLTSKGATASLVKIATVHFAQKLRSLEVGAEASGYGAVWEADPEVRLVTKYFTLMGYGWKPEVIDPRQNIYRIQLQREGKTFSLAQASSGEREILNILLGIFALNISNGLVIIDEPELHLHPKWQAFLRDLFVELAKDTGNQFLITTHSSLFVSTNTIDNVHRIFRDKSGNSCHKVARPVNELQPKDMLHIVNTQNNEKMFFADKVVLVEGIQDKLIIETLISMYHRMLKRVTTIEVLEVGGKYNFDKYERFLSRFGVDTYIVTDQDYICSFGDATIKAFFTTDFGKIDKSVLKGKKSQDRKSLGVALDKAFAARDLDVAQHVWDYIQTRFVKLRDNLSKEELEYIEKSIKEFARKKVFVLRFGEIEEYLPNGYKDLDKIPDLIKEQPFRKWLKDNWDTKEIKELKYIACKILEVSNDEDKTLDRAYRSVRQPPRMDT